MTSGVDRAREELAAARSLCDGDFAAQAVSGASRAAVRAAEDALLLLGRSAAHDPDVVTAFVRFVVRERGLDPEVGRLLRSLLNRGRQVERTHDAVPPGQAPAAIRDATAVVDAVAAWVDRSIQVAAERGPRNAPRPPRRARRR